jgi:hypothetical protein
MPEIEAWHDFFLTVGGGAAALTGLVVVAMSMHLEVILADHTLRHRARMILMGLSATFLRCSLALMGGMTARGVAVALLVVCLIALGIGFTSYRPVSRLRTRHTSSFVRTTWAMVCYAVESVGAALLLGGVAWGLRLAAIAMLANLAVQVSGAWLLLLGCRQDETA